MPNNTYFVFDNKLCKAEGMTKEQILNAIYEATGVMPQDVDAGFITTILEGNNNRSIHFWYGTMAEYNELETHDANTLYFIDGDSTIDDLEAAVQNLNDELTETKSDVTELQNAVDTSSSRFQIATQRTNGSYTTQNQLQEGLYIARFVDKDGADADVMRYITIYVEEGTGSVDDPFYAESASGCSENGYYDYYLQYYRGGDYPRKLVLMRIENPPTVEEPDNYVIEVMKIGL